MNILLREHKRKNKKLRKQANIMKNQQYWTNKTEKKNINCTVPFHLMRCVCVLVPSSLWVFWIEYFSWKWHTHSQFSIAHDRLCVNVCVRLRAQSRKRVPSLFYFIPLSAYTAQYIYERARCTINEISSFFLSIMYMYMSVHRNRFIIYAQ